MFITSNKTIKYTTRYIFAARYKLHDECSHSILFYSMFYLLYLTKLIKHSVHCNLQQINISFSFIVHKIVFQWTIIFLLFFFRIILEAYTHNIIFYINYLGIRRKSKICWWVYTVYPRIHTNTPPYLSTIDFVQSVW
jgi:hypothetical protein